MIFFQHIPKTAGTSINTIVKLEYNKDNVYPWDNLKYWELIEELKKSPNAISTKCEILKGHYPFGIHNFFSGDFQYTTFLREPIARTISHLKQFIGMSNSPISNEIKEHGLNFVLDKYADYAFENLQSRWISGCYSNELSHDEVLEKAKYNLDKYFPVFGITENFDQSVLWMQKCFSWKSPPLLFYA